MNKTAPLNMSPPQAMANTPRGVKLSIVVPCYNEGEALGITIPTLLDALAQFVATGICSEDSYIVLVDDGSKDDTWTLISQAATASLGRLEGVKLARNFGHQAALLSGLTHVTGHCDIAISMDADLQHDLGTIPLMVSEYHRGAELVLGVRDSREVDSFFKRTTALCFYKLMRLMGVSLTENHADFRLMSAAALANLQQFSEVNVFLRGLMPLLHNQIAIVSFTCGERVAGSSKYSLSKMLALAWNGITSFSVVPLRMISIIGCVVFLGSLGMAAYALLRHTSGATLPGWTSIVIPIYLLGGALMLSLGVVGEYLSKLFLEAKQRPRFLIDAVASSEGITPPQKGSSLGTRANYK